MESGLTSGRRDIIALSVMKNISMIIYSMNNLIVRVKTKFG